MSTLIHASYWAHSLSLAHPMDQVKALSHSLGNARVDLNPHQIDAALFALRSPYSKGVMLADEVGLGKTIEASLILAQKWAERRRKILLIVPATLRKQWQLELEGKFFLPSWILEAKTLNELVKKGHKNPFEQTERIAICSYQFAYTKRRLIQEVQWDLVVVDEAHRLRSVYKGTKTPEGIVEAIRPAQKLLLTATPLQNTLLELFGLVGILDPEIFGGQDAFNAQFMNPDDVESRDAALRERIKNVCKRTLRRQVLEYIKYTERFTHTADFIPSPAEEQLYEEVSRYLQRDLLAALPNARRQLMTLILRKLLASSSAAIGATLEKFATRLRDETTAKDVAAEEILKEDYESLDEAEEEWDEEATQPAIPSEVAKVELADLDRFVALAKSIERDSKATKLIEALPTAFKLAEEKGAARKAVIFTESKKTQEYLFNLLSSNGFADKIVLMNGTNTDAVSQKTYAEWKKRNAHRWDEVTSGSKTADMKAAIVEEFRDRGVLLLATESAAEGVNLQFCSIVVNYDLPWNPQRIEQRIGRCHRYGQKSDVLVVNFLNRKNAADQRVFELLSQKFKLFEGVFGASDDVLGVVESGVDLEKSVVQILQSCRTPEQIQTAFDELQDKLDTQIQAGLENARRAFLENFDTEVHERLQMHKDEAKASLGAQQQMLLDLAKFSFAQRAAFDAHAPKFHLQQPDGTAQQFDLDWRRAEAEGATFFRIDHPLAQEIIRNAASTFQAPVDVAFQYESHASALAKYCGQRGWLEVTKLVTEAANRQEEFLLVAACDSAGKHLTPDVATKIFSLPGRVVGEPTEAPPAVLAQIRDELRGFRVEDMETRNHSFFDEEVEKLERWAEDMKFSLEKELREIDAAIKAARKSAKSAVALAEKVESQRTIKTLEGKRNTKRKQLFDAQDEVDKKRTTLIENVEKQLQLKVSVSPIFTIRWSLDDAN